MGAVPQQGPKALTGSDDAKRKMAVILEAIAGLRTIQSAGEELGIAVVRYYALETRMLQAMVDALEPRKRGRKVDHAAELRRAKDACQELEREVMRLKALYRTTQRAVGVKDARPVRKASGKTTRARRRGGQSRGQRLVAKLKPAPDAGSVPPSSDDQGGTG